MPDSSASFISNSIRHQPRHQPSAMDKEEPCAHARVHSHSLCSATRRAVEQDERRENETVRYRGVEKWPAGVGREGLPLGITAGVFREAQPGSSSPPRGELKLPETLAADSTARGDGSISAQTETKPRCENCLLIVDGPWKAVESPWTRGRDVECRRRRTRSASARTIPKKHVGS